MVFSIEMGFCYAGFLLYDQIRIDLADVRYACVRCWFGSLSVRCALLFLCSSVDKRRMMVPFGGTDLMEETVSRIKTKLGQYYLSGYRCIQQSTTNLIRLLFGNFRRVYF